MNNSLAEVCAGLISEHFCHYGYGAFGVLKRGDYNKTHEKRTDYYDNK